MKYCAIPELPASSPFGRRILSHDTIEAALMQKAGYHVWYAYDLDGGYEESPPNLAECMARDRRWCFGNMQHLYFLFSRDIRPLSRFHLLNGILAYGGSLLWLISLVISNIIALRDSNSHSVGFLNLGVGSFLLTYVIVMLFLPKVLGAAMIFGERRQGQLGGGTKVVLNVLAEMVFSVLMAPILMLFHAQFVVAALLGSKVSWGAQTRTGDDRLAWSSAIKLFGPRTVLMLAWLAIVLWFKPAFTGWMIFVFLGPLIAIPLSVFIGSTRIGTLARERGWFLVPEETQPPEEIRRMEEEDAPSISSPYFRRRQFAEDYGLLRVILDPYINAIHVSMLRQRQRASARTRSYINVLSQKILIQGPGSLNDREKRRLLWDADAITEIHRKLWGSPAAQLDQWWQDALRHYNDNSALDMRRRIQKV